MNPQATPTARPDLDVALFDFAAEYAQDPARALYRLHFVVLDEDTCLGRIAFLRALAGAAGRGRDLPQAARPFDPEIALLCEDGLFAADAAGRLTPERVGRLDRLSRDPDALLETHRRLTGEVAGDPPAVPAESATAVKSEAPVRSGLTGFTALARAGSVADLEDRLRPWLPFLLRRAGLTDDLDEALARQFLAHIRKRAGEIRQRRFRELLPVWLSDFAREQDRAGRLRADRLRPSAADLEADAVEQVLRRAGEREAPWATAFREAALRAPLRIALALLAFEAVEVGAVAALPNYRRDLFHEARRAYRDGLELFEFDVTA